MVTIRYIRIGKERCFGVELESLMCALNNNIMVNENSISKVKDEYRIHEDYEIDDGWMDGNITHNITLEMAKNICSNYNIPESKQFISKIVKFESSDTRGEIEEEEEKKIQEQFFYTDLLNKLPIISKRYQNYDIFYIDAEKFLLLMGAPKAEAMEIIRAIPRRHNEHIDYIVKGFFGKKYFYSVSHALSILDRDLSSLYTRRDIFNNESKLKDYLSIELKDLKQQQVNRLMGRRY